MSERRDPQAEGLDLRLAVFSYKRIWRDPASATGYGTIGGFPLQIGALSQLFYATRVVAPENRGTPPPGLLPLSGRGLTVAAVPEPRGTDGRRKLRLPFWLLRHGGLLWRECGRADAVHALVPGDLGTLGLLLAWLRRKPLLVRHCGTWGDRGTWGNRFLAWLLPRIAGGRNVVLATGGGTEPPAGSRGRAAWIFSTSLCREEMEALKPGPSWKGGEPLRLVTVGRLTRGKNIAAVVEALPAIRREIPGATLEVVGHGPAEGELKRRGAELELGEALRFRGNLSHEEVLEALLEAHLFVFPTRVAEGFPKAVVEAMACGLPVLAPPVSVLPRLVREGGGWLLEGTDEEAVTKAVLAAAADPEELARRGAAARRTARKYTLEAWGEEIRRRVEAAWGAGRDTAGTGPAAPGPAAPGPAAPSGKGQDTAGTGPAAPGPAAPSGVGGGRP